MPVKLDQYLSVGMTYRDNPDQGKLLPVSHLPWGGPDHHRETVNWDVSYADPENMRTGWTVLSGGSTGLHYDVSAAVRLWYGSPGASGHIGFWHAEVVTGPDGKPVDTRVATQEVFDWPVMPLETGHSHVGVHWKGWLPAGQRLRCEVTLWNAPDDQPMRIVGGTLRAFYGRPS